MKNTILFTLFTVMISGALQACDIFKSCRGSSNKITSLQQTAGAGAQAQAPQQQDMPAQEQAQVAQEQSAPITPALARVRAYTPDIIERDLSQQRITPSVAFAPKRGSSGPRRGAPLSRPHSGAGRGSAQRALDESTDFVRTIQQEAGLASSVRRDVKITGPAKQVAYLTRVLQSATAQRSGLVNQVTETYDLTLTDSPATATRRLGSGSRENSNGMHDTHADSAGASEINTPSGDDAEAHRTRRGLGAGAGAQRFDDVADAAKASADHDGTGAEGSQQ